MNCKCKIRNDMDEAVNYKKQDREKILNYLEGKHVVSVADIMANSQAEKLRVYPILFEFEMEGKIRVNRRKALGAPSEVTMIW